MYHVLVSFKLMNNYWLFLERQYFLVYSSTTVQNVPHTDHDTVNLEPLNEEHRIYAETKLAAEEIVKTARSYNIMRIWDID